MAKKLISVENTRFIFRTNFAGDPTMDKFGSPQRKGNVVIDKELADELAANGFNVKETVPKDGEEDGFEPEYFVSVIVNLNSNFPPTIKWVSGDNPPVDLDEDSIGIIDRSRISNVDVVLNPHEYTEGKFTLYVRTMYVTQDLDADPFAAKYARKNEAPEHSPVDNDSPL